MTKSLVREKIWFPGIDRQVEDMIKVCAACEVTVPAQKFEPLNMSTLPSDGPWTELSIDFSGPFPNGYYLMVVTDDYTRYPVTETITSASAKTVIPKLANILSMFGIPKVIRSDNGPPFHSEEFKGFSQYMGFRHRKITPLWPRAIGEAERFMRTLKKAIATAIENGLPWEQGLSRFLMNYRVTPHTSKGKAPAELLFGR
ncbi:uncharacterized protein K02A2.6-like [Anneissia japonica]|uniref:uncharacterized protein K02A2.6-like n=1 Tax=Anneissia japonica TaxID=1529436 RepID=UPI00142587F3|nr:uncharacterized protein K02A2.6-like [Anneissia japonica]